MNGEPARRRAFKRNHHSCVGNKIQNIFNGFIRAKEETLDLCLESKLEDRKLSNERLMLSTHTYNCFPWLRQLANYVYISMWQATSSLKLSFRSDPMMLLSVAQCPCQRCPRATEAPLSRGQTSFGGHIGRLIVNLICILPESPSALTVLLIKAT